LVCVVSMFVCVVCVHHGLWIATGGWNLNARVLFWQNEIFLPVAIAGSRSRVVGSSVAVEVNRIESSWKFHINR
jgi:hypothetical protein